VLNAEAARARARLAAHRGDVDEAERSFKQAIQRFEELGTPFFLARTQLQYAELLVGRDGELPALRGEAMATFEALGADPWLERARSLRAEVAA
jgi:hypothetical protein